MDRLKGKVALISGGWAVVFLASEEASFITGAELAVDGDYTAA